MIQEQDLKVGNLIQVIGKDGYCEITGIRKQKVKDGWYYSVIVNDEKESHYLLDHLHPIPLTPEVLLKCGFEFIKEYVYPDGSKGDVFKYNIHFITPYYNGEGLSWILAGAQSCCGNQIKYLHQLQNLYFALTGTELTINL